MIRHHFNKSSKKKEIQFLQIKVILSLFNGQIKCLLSYY